MADTEKQRFNAVTDDQRLRVLREQCATCIFRPGNLLELASGAVKDVVRQSLANDTAVICHDTLALDVQAVCRGFADRYDTTPIEMARQLGMYAEIDPPANGYKAVKDQD